MLSKRKSLNDDLIIWHGMSKQNMSIAVKGGLPFAMRRRKIWLDIVSSEVQKKSKSIVAQNFTFSTRPGPSSFSMQHEGAAEDDSSFVDVPLEQRVVDIIEALPHNLPIRVDEYNITIITHITSILLTEIKDNNEATRILSFMIYREQIPSNRRPCIPTSEESLSIYRDVLESCINQQVPSLYKQMMALEVDRGLIWRLFEVGISDLIPLVLRVRILDMVLVKGCVVLVSVMLTYLTWRQEAFIDSPTADVFEAHASEEHKQWLKDDELEAFWQKLVQLHSEEFLSSYVNLASLMRLKTVAMGKQRDSDLPVLRQFQQEIFTHRQYSWIGFDVDHTLAEYKLPFLLKASFEAAAKELQQSFIGLRALPPAAWIPEIAQRGIAIDANRGNFLHMAEDGTIQRAYHGSHEVSYFSINVLYGGHNKQNLNANSSKFIYLNTTADLIFAPLYAWIVDAFDSGAIAAEEMGASLYVVPEIDDRVLENPNDPFLANRLVYISLSSFALRAARAYYAGAFWKTICSHPELLIHTNLEIRELLDSLKDDNKQLFILTNSSLTHCNEVLKAAIGKDWGSYFDIVFTEAKKEVFFDELNEMPFMEVDPEDSLKGQKRVVQALDKGKIYAGGNVKTLMHFFDEAKGDVKGLILPPRICYFGDHLMHDVLLPAQHTMNWDLVAVIKEIQTLSQTIEKEPSSSSLVQWISSVFVRETPIVAPDVYSSFFFLGRTGTATYMGKKVMDAAAICIHSVAKLARHRAVFKLYMVQQGMGRYSTSSEIKSISKRVSAKVRAITKTQSNHPTNRRSSIRSETIR